MANTACQDIQDSLRPLCNDEARPWHIGLSGANVSTLVTALVFDAVLFVPLGKRAKAVTLLCTETRLEIPAISKNVETALDHIRPFSEREVLTIKAHLPSRHPNHPSVWVSNPIKFLATDEICACVILYGCLQRN